jgi:hypothetical protein
MSAIRLTTLVRDIAPGFAPILGALFFSYSQLQIPQSDFCAVPATGFVKDLPQLMLDFCPFCAGLGRDLSVRTSLKNQRRDSPLSACKISVVG